MSRQLGRRVVFIDDRLDAGELPVMTYHRDSPAPTGDDDKIPRDQTFDFLDVNDAEPLRLEQQAFLNAVADRSLRPEVSAEDGLAAMECAEMILDSMKKHSWD